MPEVSIVIPSYNSFSTIYETLESVKSQTFHNWECIIVDDHSSDQSYDIILAYSLSDSRFIPFRLTSNSGVSTARNYGIEKATGKYIAFLDADDIWHNGFLESSLRAIIDSKGLVYSSYNRFLDIPSRLSFERHPPKIVTFNNLLLNNHLPLLTVIFERDLIKNIRFSSDRPEDYIFWLQLFMSNPGLIGKRASNLPMADYRVSKNQRSANKLKTIRRVFNCYRKHLKMNIFVSTIYTILYILHSLFDYLRQYLSIRCQPNHADLRGK